MLKRTLPRACHAPKVNHQGCVGSTQPERAYLDRHGAPLSKVWPRRMRTVPHASQAALKPGFPGLHLPAAFTPVFVSTVAVRLGTDKCLLFTQPSEWELWGLRAASIFTQNTGHASSCSLPRARAGFTQGSDEGDLLHGIQYAKRCTSGSHSCKAFQL